MANEKREADDWKPGPDLEIHALHMLAEALEPLDRSARQRVLDYARKRFLDAEVPSPVILQRADGGPTRPVTLDDFGLHFWPLASLKSFMQTEKLADLADFRYVPEPVVLKMRGMGDKSLKDFKAALAQVGVVLGGDFPRGAFVGDWKAHMERAKALEAECMSNTEEKKREEP